MRISDWSSDVCSSDLAGGVVGGEGREETGNLEDQIRTPFGQPGTIVRGLVVPPGVVGDGQADVVLAARVVGHPPSRAQVEELFGCLLAAVAAALPREAGSGEAGGTGGVAGSGESAPAVVEQGSADRGEVCTDDGEDEQLVPEDVAAVALAVQTAGGDSGVDLDGVGRDGGEEVVGVQVGVQLCVALCVELDAEVPPQSPPRRLVGFEKLGRSEEHTV